jgi:hypothetical protein
MTLFLIALTLAGGGFVAKRWRERTVARRDEQDELENVKRFAAEDVTVLGEQLQRLDREVEGRALDEPSRIDYQVALDSYESAGRAVARIRKSDEISTITDSLSAGRYALACVQARLAGRPLPELRVPCFFNPQHGPSVTDVVWTPRSGGTRTVPACAQDAARVASHDDPEVRKVRLGSRMVPYWEAGAAYQPYAAGYFAGAAVMIWAFQPAGSVLGYDIGTDYGGAGGGGGYDGGGFDGGGFEGGGFDGGGAGDGGGG